VPLGFATIGVGSGSLFEGSRGNEIANRDLQLLGSLYDFRRFVKGIIREQGFSNGGMQPSASNRRIFAHALNVTKNFAERIVFS
jgi:hypothetical protein